MRLVLVAADAGAAIAPKTSKTTTAIGPVEGMRAYTPATGCT
jgi:hypothetical protein